MDVDTDRQHMQRAINLARRGRGLVEPNPPVGCVLVKEGRVIAEAWHERFGYAHAEAAALRACDESPEGATAYVSMEPCCHEKKKTPPCVPSLIEARLARVVVGAIDPNPQVSGKGIEQLRAAGIQVDTGILEAEANQLIAPFIAMVREHRPYVTLKWAQSAEGHVAANGGTRVQISNEASMRVVHELRGRCDAILVGANTAIGDDPLLTVRSGEVLRTPIRIVLDTALRVDLTSQLVTSRAHGGPPVLLCCSDTAYDREEAKIKELDRRGVEVLALAVEEGEDRLSLGDLLDELHSRQIMHLLVEAGPRLATAFLKQNLADRVWIFRSPMKIPDNDAPMAPEITFEPTGELALAGDRLTEYLNPNSPVFFTKIPTPDATAVGM